jgi:RNA polymerase sigma-70 factor (ECF subfamily)
MLHELIGNREVRLMDQDRILVQACLRVDQDAWEIMVQTHSKRILNLCLRYAGRKEEAEDLTQEIFVRIYRSLRSFRLDSGSFQCWIVRVARNLIIDHYRKERRHQTPIGSEEMENLHLEDEKTPSPSRAFERAEASRILLQALDGLSPDLREAVVLRDLEGLSYQQVAETTGVSEGTVKSRLFRARLRLAKIFSGRALHAPGLARSVILQDLVGSRILGDISATAA